MKYEANSFTIAPSGSYEAAYAACRSHGHMDADVRGKCLRCGEKVGAASAERQAHFVAHKRAQATGTDCPFCAGQPSTEPAIVAQLRD